MSIVYLVYTSLNCFPDHRQRGRILSLLERGIRQRRAGTRTCGQRAGLLGGKLSPRGRECWREVCNPEPGWYDIPCDEAFGGRGSGLMRPRPNQALLAWLNGVVTRKKVQGVAFFCSDNLVTNRFHSSKIRRCFARYVWP